MFRLSITDCSFIFVSNCATIIQVFVLRIAWLSIGYVIRNTFFKSINLFPIFFSNIEILIFISSFIDETKDFNWTSNFNIAFNKNKIISLNSGQEDITSYITWDNKYRTTPAYISKKGEAAGKMYGFNVCCFQCKFKTVIAQLTYI